MVEILELPVGMKGGGLWRRFVCGVKDNIQTIGVTEVDAGIGSDGKQLLHFEGLYREQTDVKFIKRHCYSIVCFLRLYLFYFLL